MCGKRTVCEDLELRNTLADQVCTLTANADLFTNLDVMLFRKAGSDLDCKS